MISKINNSLQCKRHLEVSVQDPSAVDVLQPLCDLDEVCPHPVLGDTPATSTHTETSKSIHSNCNGHDKIESAALGC